MNLEDYINAYIHPTETLLFKTSTCEYKKQSKIIVPGRIDTNIYFIVSGILEVGRIADGKETIFDFMFPNSFIYAFSADPDRQEYADIYVSCITDCVLEKLPLEDIINAQKISLIANQLGALIFEEISRSLIQKEIDARIKTTKQRYLDLIEHRPQLIKETSDDQIAKYLAIHPNSLSRLKNKLKIEIE